MSVRSSSTFAQIAIDGRYWKYDGRHALSLGGWNHSHNPFIDHDTDNDKDNKGVSTAAQIKKAMDELAAAGGNCLRCVLDPGMAAGIQGVDFCAKSGTQYDLNTMTGPFWTRLEMFIAEAKKRSIIVQIELWDRFDLIDGGWGSWPVSPWNPKNNIDHAIEDWWRSLLAGVAGVRFHRPTSGIGLYDTAKNCISATRKVESRVKFWDVEPRLDLLTNRQSDEAYLAADPGKAYILYFTKNGGGSVGLKLDGHSDATFELRWVDIGTGNWGPATTISGGSTVTMDRPNGSSHWVATIVR